MYERPRPCGLGNENEPRNGKRFEHAFTSQRRDRFSKLPPNVRHARACRKVPPNVNISQIAMEVFAENHAKFESFALSDFVRHIHATILHASMETRDSLGEAGQEQFITIESLCTVVPLQKLASFFFATSFSHSTFKHIHEAFARKGGKDYTIVPHVCSLPLLPFRQSIVIVVCMK